MTYTDKELREEFQNFADSIVWSNDDGSEKYIGVGNMADWWLKKIHQAVAEERVRVGEKMESALEDYFNGRYPIPDHKVISGYLREALSSLEPLTDK